MQKLALILMVLILGCSDSGLRPGSELPALVIREYYFDQNSIKQGQTTGVNLVVQNLGGEKARNIKTKLFRAEEGISLPYENIQSAAFINPPDEGTKTPGESKEFEWEIGAKILPTDQKTAKSYNIGVLVGYDYKSEGFSDLLATTKEQAKIDKNNLPALRSGSTKGPITVTVITPNTILYGKDEKVTARVDVVNGANGVVYANRNTIEELIGDADSMNKIKSLEIQIPASEAKFDAKVGTDLGNNLWCCKPGCDKSDLPEKAEYAWIMGKTSDNKYITLKKTYNDNIADPDLKAKYRESLELLRGKQKSYVCYFLIDKAKIPEQQIIPIRAIAEYSYSTEDSKILVVEGAK